jgi:hypothetical protein
VVTIRDMVTGEQTTAPTGQLSRQLEQLASKPTP